MYLAFDLDSTLGDFMGVWNILCALRQPSFFKSPDNIAPYPNKSFEVKIHKTYDEFVRLVAEEERGKTPLGLFRPGIFEIFREVVRLKRNGDCDGVIVYSNNGCKAILEFVCDVVRHILKYKVFDDLIHFHHKLRIKAEAAVDVRKNWTELKKILVEGDCQALDNISPQDVMFFDDQIHQDLVNNLGDKYIKVDSYETVPNKRAIIELYKSSLRIAGLDVNSTFLAYVGSCFNKPVLSAEKYFKSLLDSDGKGLSSLRKDTSIKTMVRALKTLRRKKIVKKSKRGVSMKKY